MTGAGAVDAPLVSVVIPTRDRPELVLRAVHSALDQRLRQLEVLVVVDGPDAATDAALARVADPRLRRVSLPRPGGAGAARNAGVLEACGRWIAFLDDDDEWLPEKLARQVEAAGRIGVPHPVIGCQIIARSPEGDAVWPLRAPDPGETVGDYLFRRRGLFHGEGTIQTGMLLVPRDLLLRVPFSRGLKRFQETDWLLRVSAVPGFALHMVMEPLAIWYHGERRATITGGTDWREAREWLREVRPLITAQAFTEFMMTNVAHQARTERAWNAFPALLGEAWRSSRPDLRSMLLYIGMWTVPQRARVRLRSLLRRGR